jgi:hypothetical protein
MIIITTKHDLRLSYKNKINQFQLNPPPTKKKEGKEYKKETLSRISS